MTSLARNCITTGLLCATGDILSQTIDQSQPYNIYSTLRNSFYGLAIFGPIGHNLYPLLEKVKPFSKPSANLLTRVAVDQVVWAPIGVALYLSSMSLMEGRTTNELELKLKHVYWGVLVTNWTVWPLFQAANFTLLAPHNRLLAVNCASVVWNSYMSWKNRHSFDPKYAKND